MKKTKQELLDEIDVIETDFIFEKIFMYIALAFSLCMIVVFGYALSVYIIFPIFIVYMLYSCIQVKKARFNSRIAHIKQTISTL